MASKIKFINNSSCGVCSRTIFHFEGRVNARDLDQEEKTQCAALFNSHQSTLEHPDTIMCVPCYRKLNPDSGQIDAEYETGESENQLPSAERLCGTGQIMENNTATTSPSNHSSAINLQENSLLGASVRQRREQPAAENPSSRVIEKDNSNNTPVKGVSHGLLAVVGVLMAVVAVSLVGGVWTTVVVVGVAVAVAGGLKHQEVGRWLHFARKTERHGVMDSDKQVSSLDPSQAAAAVIVSGDSLGGTSTRDLLQKEGYFVMCGIEVENWTRFPLLTPHAQIMGGTLTLPPSTISPATRQVMVARKTSGIAAGTCGTVSWLIQPMNRRLVVMWSAPFNFNHHSNWLAVGLTKVGTVDHAPGDVWFNQMYYKDNTELLSFERGEYYADIRPVVCRDREFEVEGIMNSDHQALVKVILRPLDISNLASSIRDKMNPK